MTPFSWLGDQVIIIVLSLLFIILLLADRLRY